MNRVDQIINGGQAVFFRENGEMGVSGGGCGTGMPENRLDMTKA
jgi:hypothetical protein